MKVDKSDRVPLKINYITHFMNVKWKIFVLIFMLTYSGIFVNVMLMFKDNETTAYG